MNPSEIRQENLQVSPLADDLDSVLIQTQGLWDGLRGKRLFITGGTGFFGSLLLESFLSANTRFDLGASAVILTRNSDAFRRKAPHLASHPCLRFHQGDIQDFTFPEGEFSHIIHAAATSAVDSFNNIAPLVTFDIITRGTRRVLEFAIKCKAQDMLFTSSGAVYGRQPSDMSHIPENYPGAPDSTDARYFLSESKRSAEMLCALHAKQFGIKIRIARCFSFVGPYLPLDVHYAVGNFIRDALAGGPVQVRGDGAPHRSYLYTSDLLVWLWTILFKGESCRAYNVGSEEDMTIADVARRVGQSFAQPVDVTIASAPIPGKLIDRYVPSTQRVQKELGLKQSVDFRTAIDRTIAYHRSLGR